MATAVVIAAVVASVFTLFFALRAAPDAGDAACEGCAVVARTSDRLGLPSVAAQIPDARVPADAPIHVPERGKSETGTRGERERVLPLRMPPEMRDSVPGRVFVPALLPFAGEATVILPAQPESSLMAAAVVEEPASFSRPESSAAAGAPVDLDAVASKPDAAESATTGSGSRVSLQGANVTAVAPAAPVSDYGFQWPLQGPITSYFGPGHPLGIDIGTRRQVGLPILAADGGTVILAGGRPCCSYGYYVLLQHEDGFQTLYGHLSRIDVAYGDQVRRGAQIGLSGNTGYSTGPHLHFEIRRYGAYLNPLWYLP